MSGILICGYFLHAFYDSRAGAFESAGFDTEEKKITLKEDGLSFEVVSHGKTVDEVLKEQKINIGSHDNIFPALSEKLFSGSNIIIEHARKIMVTEGGKKNEIFTTARTVEGGIWEQKNIELGDDDVTIPARGVLIKDGMDIKVVHVLVKEETKNLDIAFKTTSNEDDSLGWRIKKTTQKGEVGIKEVKYRVVYNDGKEISRKILDSNITKDPVDEIITQGTMVKVGKTYTGAASWYAYTGTLSAANPWLPMGSYARVTNKDNGKSVIVKINDRGPFGNGRIIDLDKVAFATIASIGAGVANVKVEAITN